MVKCTEDIKLLCCKDDGRALIQKGLVNLKESTKSTRPGSVFQSPIPREDMGLAGVKNRE